ncbi:MAG: hypothetical protein IPK72_21130 [Candidatus Eisenbacteria bacterium]|nr:hypothetical protein [Candidatus Eisenbacteria bacterium]
MNYRSLVQTIARTLAAVEGVGKVHPLRRFAKNPSDVEALFVDSGKLNGWTVSRSAFTNEHIATNATHEKAHSFVIRGFFAWTETPESEIEFNEILDRIADAFSPSSDLGEEVEIAGPIVAREIDFVQTANTLAHYCELEFSVIELSNY